MKSHANLSASYSFVKLNWKLRTDLISRFESETSYFSFFSLIKFEPPTIHISNALQEEFNANRSIKYEIRKNRVNQNNHKKAKGVHPF